MNDDSLTPQTLSRLYGPICWLTPTKSPAKTAKKDSYFIDYASQARYAPPFVNNSIDFERSTP